MPILPRQNFDEGYAQSALQGEIDRGEIITNRIQTGAVTTTKLAENAAQELIVAEINTSGALTTYGSWEQILAAEVVGSGFPAILSFSAGYATTLSLSTGPSIYMDMRVFVEDNTGAAFDTAVSGTVCFFDTSATDFLYQPFYQILLEDPLLENDVYTVYVEARRTRDDSGDTLGITFTRRFLMLQEVKR